MIKSFKFLTKNVDNDIPTPQEIRDSPWLSGIYRMGWNAGHIGDVAPPPEFTISPRTFNTWVMGFRDSYRLVN